MPISLPFYEPKTADYIYIDTDNHVHLMVPIVGGDTIGLDNTCKTVKEMQTFFASAAKALDDYRIALENDLKLLTGGSDEDLFASKYHRLQQIAGYLAIFTKMQRELQGRYMGGEYPGFPPGVLTLLQRQTNCLSVLLSPKTPDLATRMPAPIFSLNRKNEWSDPSEEDLAPEPYDGLGPSLRKKLLEALQSREPTEAISLKQQVIDAVNQAFPDPAKRPTLSEVQKALKRIIKTKVNEEIDFTKDSRNIDINEAYFIDVFMDSEEEFAARSAGNLAEAILSACISDDFWAMHNTDSLLTPQAATTLAEQRSESKELAIKVQFFLAQINIYCRVHGLSQADFGKVIEEGNFHASVAKHIAHAVKHNKSVEETLFAIVEALKTELGLTRSLTANEQKNITETFTAHYNTIKDSPHFDEFMLFFPEVQGDFFNHKSRVSVHFLDLVDTTVLDTREREWVDFMKSHMHLSTNAAALKAGSERRLQPNNNPNPPISIASFLKLINDTTYREFAALLCAKKPYPITTLTSDELSLLMAHSHWKRMDREIRKILTGTDLETYSHFIAEQAASSLTPALSIMNEKIMSSGAQRLSPSPLLNDTRWEEAIGALETVIASYKDKRSYQSKSTVRKQQIGQLDEILEALKAQRGSRNENDRVDVIKEAMKLFTQIDEAIARERYFVKPSSLKRNLNDVKERFSTLFGLHSTVIGTHPLNPEQAVKDREKLLLNGWSQYTVLHGLKASWWEARSLEIIKQLPPAYYKESTVAFLNTINPASLDAHVLKTLQTDTINFDEPVDLEVLRTRGKFLAQLGDAVEYLPLRGLNAAWWGEDIRIALLQTLHADNITAQAVAFLNTIHPEQFDAEVWETLQTEPIDFTQPITIETLRARGQLLTMSKEPAYTVLRNLNEPWWNADQLAKILTIHPENLTEALVTFLNSVSPSELDDDALRLLQTEPLNIDEPIALDDLRKRGRQLVEEDQDTSSQEATPEVPLRHEVPAFSSPLSRYKALRGQIKEAQAQYEGHVNQQWTFGIISRAGQQKNKIIQENLSAALRELRAGTSTLADIKGIIEETKRQIKEQYGEQSWSWYQLKYTTSESCKLLTALVEVVEQEMHQPAPSGIVNGGAH